MLPLSATHASSSSSSCSSGFPFFITEAFSRNKEKKILGHQRHRELKLLRSLISPAMAAILTLSTPYLITTPASQGQPIELPKAAVLFQRSCIGCHDGGGNILQPGATLFAKDLERNGIATEEEIYNITYSGKSRMPGFGEKCTPRGQCTFGPRLQDQEIELLAKFVKLQADNGWPSIETYKD